MEPVFDFSASKSPINPANIVSFPSTTALDEKSSLYLCQVDKHRILKFNLNGNLLKQIGHEGHEKQSLYYPQGVYVKDHRYRVNDWKDQHLISIFTKSGKISGSFGRTHPAKRLLVYRILNRTYLSIYGDFICGAFEFVPVVFRYNLNGKEILFKDLRDITFDDELERMLSRSLDDSEEDHIPGRVRAITYISGFYIDGAGNYLLSINFSEKKKAVMLVLNQDGEPSEKYLFKSKENSIFPLYKTIGNSSGDIYITGMEKGSSSLILYKWKSQAVKDKE